MMMMLLFFTLQQRKISKASSLTSAAVNYYLNLVRLFKQHVTVTAHNCNIIVLYSAELVTVWGGRYENNSKHVAEVKILSLNVTFQEKAVLCSRPSRPLQKIQPPAHTHLHQNAQHAVQGGRCRWYNASIRAGRTNKLRIQNRP